MVGQGRLQAALVNPQAGPQGRGDLPFSRVALGRPRGIELPESWRRFHVERHGRELGLGEPLEESAGHVEVQQAR